MTGITASRVDDEKNVVDNLTNRLDADLPILATRVLSLQFGRLWMGEFVKRFSGIEGQALRKLDMLHTARGLNDLRAPPANRLEALTGNRRGQHSIRINEQWRVCFRWPKDEPGPSNVEIVDYH